MDIIGLLINLVSGAIGGNLTGAALKDQSLGAIGNTIAGIVGGVAGSYILQAVGVLNSLGLADMTMGSLLGNAGSSVVAGGVLTAIVGVIKNMIKKS
jgi:uncharacterized membrane protein YeaQ/YmgE (transglycosylase-associated protein family)